MDEFELKFQVPHERLAAVEAALRRGPVESIRLRARYYDTATRALATRGVTLRLRQEGRQWVQTVKGRGTGSFHRLEHNAPLPAGAARHAPDPARHDGHPLQERLKAALRADPSGLHEVFATDITRLARVIGSAGTAVEVALDQGELRANGRRHLVQELEFELKQGSPAAVVELAQSWCREHGLWIDPLSKSAQGYRLAAGEHAPPAVQAQPQQGAADSAAQLLAGVLSSALDQVLGNARELPAGTGGDEHVHQLRVGIRRLRTILRELAEVPALETLDPATEPALRTLFGVLGEHRDRRTLVARLALEVAEAGGPALTWQPALPDAGAAVRDPLLQSALLDLLRTAQHLHAGAAPDGSGIKRLRRIVRRRLHRLHGAMERDGERFDALPAAERHRVRKRLKRLRYLSELMRPLFDGAAVDRYVKCLRGLQDALGRYQDAAAGRLLFAELAAQEPGAWFAVGWLAARERELAVECATACRRTVDKARPFW